MDNVHFIVFDNPRLKFKDAGPRVFDFVRSRLEFAGVGSVVLTDSRDAARQEAAALSKRIGRGTIFLHDIMNPLVDVELVREMVAAQRRTGHPMSMCDGAVPGTQVEFGLDAAAAGQALAEVEGRFTRVRWNTQARFNNQFNLYKYKRLKMFLTLVDIVPDLHTQSVAAVIETLCRDDVFARMAAFGEDVPLVYHDSCPHCSGRISALPLSMSQPFCGYLPSSRPLYHECERCGLVIASPVLREQDLPRIYDEWDRQDFVASLNNPYHAGATRCDFGLAGKYLPVTARTLDLGGGMGRFSQYLKETYPAWHVTHSDFEIKRNLELEPLGIKTRAINFLSEPIGSALYDLVTAWEVVEHIPFERLAQVLKNIHGSLSPGGFFIFSTPDFDSPLCKSMDFFGLCPPFHYTVLSRRWLNDYFSQSPDWEIVEMRSCSDFLDDALMWYDYASKTSPTMQLRGTAETLRTVFTGDTSHGLRRSLLKQGVGTEIIVALRKRGG